MIRGTIAFNAHQVSPRTIRIEYGEVDEESSDTNLTIDLVAKFSQLFGHLRLKLRVKVSSGRSARVQLSCFGVFEKRLERGSTDRSRTAKINIFSPDRTKDFASFTCSGNQHIESPLTTLSRKRAEAHRKVRGPWAP